MDTFVLNALVQQLRQQICPSKINTIWQPDDDSLILGLWIQKKEWQLSMSVSPRHQYLFLTNTSPDNTIFAFGKFLLHHIKGGELRTLQKPRFERILTFDIVRKDIDNQELRFQLILELMGRYSNLILVNQDTRKILDSLHHVTAAQSSYRRIAPAAEYVPPPQQEKFDPLSIDRKRFFDLLNAYDDLSASQPLWKFLVAQIQGLSPLLAKEIAGQEALNTDHEARWQRFVRLAEVIRSEQYQPGLVMETDHQGKQSIMGLSAFALQTEVCTPTVSMNHAVAEYVRQVVEGAQYDALKNALVRPLNARLGKLQKKQGQLLAQQAQIDSAEQYKKQGELLTTHLYQLKKGMATAAVVDYYDERLPLIEITLDPRLTPAQNAQQYFKRYNKLKQGKAITLQRLRETEQEIAALEERKFFLEEADSFARLKELQEEVIDEEPSGKKGTPRRRKGVQQPSQPFWRFVSSDGFDIYVGKSSKENDLLTQRTALPDDIWLHVQHAPGSHVLILNRNRNAPVPEQTLRQAASLAAYYSKLRQSNYADVIYTPKKYVKKPKGSPPGLVIVSQSQTIRVTPENRLLKNG